MASARSIFGRAVAAHRQARGLEQAARVLLHDAERSGVLPGAEPPSGPADDGPPGLADLVHRLAQAGDALTPGWWTASWDAPPSDRGFGQDGAPGRWSLVRIGAAPVGDGFPVVVPFVGAGHLALDLDGGDVRVAGFLRGVLLRVLAAMPAGSVRVLPVDGAGLGGTFAPLRPLIGAGLMSEPATDLAGLRAVLAEAEQRIRQVQVGADAGPLLVLAVAALPPGGQHELDRLSVLARAGVEGGVHLLVAGHPNPARLADSTAITRAGEAFQIGEPPGSQRFSAAGTGLAVPVVLDTGPPGRLLAAVCGRIAERAVEQAAVPLADLLPGRIWTQASATGLTAPVGRGGHGTASVTLDAAAPHWLVGGRTGSGTTPVLLDLLAALSARYSPDELGLYLLDFADGVCFAELVPTELDPTWVPQVRAIGIECDREYGVAVLGAVVAEVSRRVAAMKQTGATDLAGLRTARSMSALPRLVVAIEEAGRLFGGPEGEPARRLLGQILRRGGDCGIHLLLTGSTAAPDGLTAAELSGLHRISVLAPDAVQLDGRRVNIPVPAGAEVQVLRTRLWEARPPGHPQPARYDGSAELHVAEDPDAQALDRTGRRRVVLLGRAVELGTPVVGFALDSSPGRHLVVLGPSDIGADLLQAAVWQLCRQHPPGTARIVVAGLVAAADAAVEDTLAVAQVAGHEVRQVTAPELRRLVAGLLEPDAADPTITYLVVFGGDDVLAGPELSSAAAAALWRDGPASGVHVLGWWRSPARFRTEPAGDQVAGLVALNISADELEGVAGPADDAGWQPRPNRALLVDRQEGRRRLLVPFVRPGRVGELP
jgi:DNA segregation ATPase FtsK/SpoIIIE, S-DNA-T family